MKSQIVKYIGTPGLVLWPASAQFAGSQVTQVLVCDPQKNALLKVGNKSDRIDARAGRDPSRLSCGTVKWVPAIQALVNRWRENVRVKLKELAPNADVQVRCIAHYPLPVV